MIYRLYAWVFGDAALDHALDDLDRVTAERDDLDEALDRACAELAQWERVAADLRRQLEEEREGRWRESVN